MNPLTTLWLPILLSAVFVFFASFIAHTLLWFWHRADHNKLPDEAVVMGGLTTAKSGQYIAPHVNWNKLTEEERKAHGTRPMALLFVRNPSEMNLAVPLVGWFVECLVISTIIACIAGTAIERGHHRHAVLHLTALAGLLAYAFDGVSMSIWYGKPWSATLKTIVDGIVFAGLTGITFAWLWPL